jgi:hypothetical protein
MTPLLTHTVPDVAYMESAIALLQRPPALTGPAGKPSRKSGNERMVISPVEKLLRRLY